MNSVSVYKVAEKTLVLWLANAKVSKLRGSEDDWDSDYSRFIDGLKDFPVNSECGRDVWTVIVRAELKCTDRASRSIHELNPIFLESMLTETVTECLTMMYG